LEFRVVPYENPAKAVSQSAQRHSQTPTLPTLSNQSDIPNYSEKRLIFKLDDGKNSLLNKKQSSEGPETFHKVESQLLSSSSSTLSSTSTITLSSSVFEEPKPTSNIYYSSKMPASIKKNLNNSSTKSKTSTLKMDSKAFKNSRSKHLNKLEILIPKIMKTEENINMKRQKHREPTSSTFRSQTDQIEQQKAYWSKGYPFETDWEKKQKKYSNKNLKLKRAIDYVLPQKSNETHLKPYETRRSDQDQAPSPSAFSKYIESVHKALNSDGNIKASGDLDTQSEYMLFLQLQEQSSKQAPNTKKFENPSTSKQEKRFTSQNRSHPMTRSFSIDSSDKTVGSNYTSKTQSATNFDPESAKYVAINFLCNNIIKPTYTDECKRIMQRTNLETVAERAALFEDIDLDRYNRLKMKYASLNQSYMGNSPNSDLQQPPSSINLAHISRTSISQGRPAAKQAENHFIWRDDPQIAKYYPSKLSRLFSYPSKTLETVSRTLEPNFFRLIKSYYTIKTRAKTTYQFVYLIYTL
jgi:hypothetical protein